MNMPDLDDAPQKPMGQWVEAISDDRREPRHGEFERHRARGRHRRGGGSESVVFLALAAYHDRRHGPTLGGGGDDLRHRLGGRHDNTKPGMTPGQQSYGLTERRQEPRDLAAPAPRQ